MQDMHLSMSTTAFITSDQLSLLLHICYTEGDSRHNNDVETIDGRKLNIYYNKVWVVTIIYHNYVSNDV